MRTVAKMFLGSVLVIPWISSGQVSPDVMPRARAGAGPAPAATVRRAQQASPALALAQVQGVFSGSFQGSTGLRPHSTSVRQTPSVIQGTSQVFVVTSTDDSGAGTLRQAIHDANANAGLDYITFNITSGSPTIQPKTPFEVITSPVVIDGTTQPGYSDHPLVQLDGTLLANQTIDNGLELDVAGCMVKALAINRFAGGIIIDVAGGDTVQGCYIGTDPSGLTPFPNFVVGVEMFGPGNLIGGTTPGAGNVISANNRNIQDDGTYSAGYGGSLIQGNIIGLDPSGGTLYNGETPVTSQAGIFLYEVSSDTIGGLIPQARNIIAGNTDGIYIGNSAAASKNVVLGNNIGLDASGTHVPGNSRSGVTIWGGSNNVIGGLTDPASNIILGNSEEGIRIREGAAGNLIRGNFIGTDPSGALNGPNGSGIYLKRVHDNTIGGTVVGARNVISGNQVNGIFLDSLSTNTLVQGNLIGILPKNGTYFPLGNKATGIYVGYAPRNTIGGIGAGAGNTIGFNGWHGVSMSGDSTVQNEVVGNGIGTDGTGTMDLANGIDGVLIDASRNTIGGSLEASKNFIRNNLGAGVHVQSGQGNYISHNSISSNGGLGIDIDPSGPNPNDPLDADAGPNGGQNYPVIDSVVQHTGSTSIKGRLNSAPSRRYILEFYQNTVGDPSRYGEGETFIASTKVGTDGSGNASFDITLPYLVNLDYVITGTATDSVTGSTSEFSRFPKGIEVTRPHAGELWITGDVDTIRWTTAAAMNTVVLDYSLDSGKTFLHIADVPAKQDSFLWTVPGGILSKKSMVSATNFDDAAQVDTSGVFKIKPLVLTRDSSGEYLRYAVARHGWSFPNDTTWIWPSQWYSQFDYRNGTDPGTGLSYPEEIRKNAHPADFPDWPLFVETYGAAACYYLPGTPSYKSSAVERWLHMKESWKGSCFGLALSSFLAFDDSLTFVARFADVGAFNQLSDLAITDARRREINRLYLTQFSADRHPYIVQSSHGSPLVLLDDLKRMLKDETRNDRVLDIFDQNGAGGHALNPYRMSLRGDGVTYDVFVYDNNHAGALGYSVTVNTLQNSWNYNGFSNVWSGDGTGIALSEPLSMYLGPPSLPSTSVRPAVVMPKPAAGSSQITVYTTPDASIRITDAAGHAIGYADSMTFNTIPQAIPVVPISGKFHPPIGYDLPAGGDYSVVMQSFSDTTTHFAVFSDSSIFSYRRAGVQPAETDRIRVGSSVDVANHDNAVKTADLESIIVQPDNEKVVSLENALIRRNDSLHIDIVNRLNLKVVNAGDSLLYDLRVHRSSAAQNIEFTHAKLLIPPRSAAQIVTPWDAMQNTPVKILIDHGNVGAFDDSLFLTNETLGWNSGSDANTPVCTMTGWQTAPVIVKDGRGGSIVVWQDQRKGTDVYNTDFDLYAQRISATGWPLWALNGVPVVSDAISEVYPRIVSDGAGGAIVVWWSQTYPNSIRVQRIDSTGTIRWAPGGVPIDTYTSTISEFYSVASDDSGGVIIASQNYPPAPNDVFVQRVDSSGTVRWGAHGVPLAPAGGSPQQGIIAASDGAGGAICAWNDFRYGGTDSAGCMFAQRVDYAGNRLWGNGGVKVTNHSFAYLTIMDNTPRGYLLVWLNNSRPPSSSVRIQKIDRAGVAQWPFNGVSVVSSTSIGYNHPDFCTDGRGGAIVTWEQALNGGLGVYAQRVDSSGAGQWLQGGVPLRAPSSNNYPLPENVEDGGGGAIVIWQDYRAAAQDPNNVDIYAQAVRSDGALVWQTDGIPVTTAPKWQNVSIYYKRSIALTDTSGIAVVTWEDGRDSTATGKDFGQIYASRIVLPPRVYTGIGRESNIVGGEYRLDQNFPNPFNPTTTIQYHLPKWSHVTIDIYNILGQKVTTLVDEDQGPGQHSVAFTGTNLASGVYLYHMLAGNFVQTRKLLLLK